MAFTVKVRAGHLPERPDTVPTTSTTDDVGVGGGGVGAGVGLLVVAVVTTTVVAHVATVAAASFAVQSTAVEPTGKRDPDAGEQLVLTGVTPPEVVALNVTTTDDPFHDVALGAGHMIVSGLLSGAEPAISVDGSLRVPVPS